MSLITAYNISLNFLEKEIFKKVSLQVEDTDRIGLVGPNGSGKTTLLRMMTGEIQPDHGEIRKTKGISIGYLPQDVQESFSGPLLESVIESIENRPILRKKTAKFEKELTESSDKNKQAEIAIRLAEVHREMDDLDIRFPAHEAKKILAGLGFKDSDFQMPVSTLSGGWKTRAALAGLLYRTPDLLLLDEPTNHLDIPSIRWFEQFLNSFQGAIVVVSHDRDFLNRQVSRIISLEQEGMRFYTGNYDFYLTARQEEGKILEAKAKKQEQKIKDAKKFIDRFRAKATKARQAQSKIKLVKKMELIETHKKEKTIHFSFPDAPRSGKNVLMIKGLSKAYGDIVLYKDLDLNVLRGERIAIIGANGAGKTTLLRIISGEVKPDKGIVSLGHGVRMGYYAQHHSDILNPGNTIIEEVYNVVPDETLGFIRGLLSAFLFSGNEVDKLIGILSGGEKARVALAKLLVKPGNLMIMDEPTNHLDISSSEKLIDALRDYDGTLLFVSHNQSFINRLATKIWDISNNKVFQYPGNLYEYYDHLARAEGEDDRQKEEDISRLEMEKAKLSGKSRKALKREKAERRKQISDTLRPVMDELERVEKKIAKLEESQKKLETTLADPELFKDNEKSVPLLKEYRETKEELDRLMAKWEDGNHRLEKLKIELGVKEDL
jgi:ATP-binding cassette subfamily F protein 3